MNDLQLQRFVFTDNDRVIINMFVNKNDTDNKLVYPYGLPESGNIKFPAYYLSIMISDKVFIAHIYHINSYQYEMIKSAPCKTFFVIENKEIINADNFTEFYDKLKNKIGEVATEIKYIVYYTNKKINQ